MRMMIGWPVCFQCSVSWEFIDSQQPTKPQVAHIRSGPLIPQTWHTWAFGSTRAVAKLARCSHFSFSISPPIVLAGLSLDFVPMRGNADTVRMAEVLEAVSIAGAARPSAALLPAIFSHWAPSMTQNAGSERPVQRPRDLEFSPACRAAKIKARH